jgi:hypothetical protein
MVVPAAGDGLRFGRDLLAQTQGVATERRVARLAPSSTGTTG